MPISHVLEQQADLERAIQQLDLDPEAGRALRIPYLESVSRHRCCTILGFASLFIAQCSFDHPERVTSLRVSHTVQHEDVATASHDLWEQLALAEYPSDAAAICLQLPTAEKMEQELRLLSRECAPVIARTLGKTLLIPFDDAACMFAHELSVSAARVGSHLSLFSGTKAQIGGDACVAWAALALVENGKSLRGAKIAIVGTGPVELHTIDCLKAAGAQIVALADESGALVNRDGLEMSPLRDHILSGGLLAEYPREEHGTESQLFAFGADLLLLGDGHQAVNLSNAGTVKASIVLELGEGSVGADARNVLAAQGITVVPYALIACSRFLSSAVMSKSGQPDERQSACWKKIVHLKTAFHLTFHEAVKVFAIKQMAEKCLPERPEMGICM